jgi:hypothetical protein
MAKVQFLAGTRDISLLIASRPALRPTQPRIQWVPEAHSPGVKPPVLEADQSPPSSTEVKKGGAVPPLPPYIFKTQCLTN